MLRKFRVGLVCAVTLLTGVAQAQTESVLLNFTGTAGAALGPQPLLENLIQANDGNFYGTTSEGGANNMGTVFKVSSSGTYTLLHSFSGRAADGDRPEAGLIQGTDGDFYGTTQEGGTDNIGGTIFKITSSGIFTLLHSFTGTADGWQPEASLVQGTDGNFYGTTSGYGTTNDYGTVFKITSGGTFTLLHSFVGTDGAYPEGALVQGTDGNFYGMTKEDGVSNSSVIYGTVFKITSDGILTTLHFFLGLAADGAYPESALVQGTDGNFYGTTEYGGANSLGTIFKISSSGTFTLLHTFSGGSTDGDYPQASLVQGSDGNFYGTSYGDGVSISDGGNVFSISSSGAFTLLYPFPGGSTDGTHPATGLVQGADGNFYGTTISGGVNTSCQSGCGTVFKLIPSPTLTAPIVFSAPARQSPGSNFIFGYSVANATSDTMQQCFATNTAGDTTGWVGIKAASTSTQTAVLTASSTPGTYTYTLTCGGMESSQFNIIVAADTTAPDVSVSAVNTTYGSTSPLTVTATESGSGGSTDGSVVTFGVSGSATGSFSPATCTITSGSCTTSYIPTGMLAVGSYLNDITAGFSAIGDYSAARATSNLTITAVGSTTQTISFSQPAPAYMGTSVLLTGTASSGLPVTYSVVSGPATVSGAVLTYTGVGTVGVEADQAGDATYAAAPAAQQTVTTTLLREPVGTASGSVMTTAVFSSMGTLGSIAVLTGGATGLDFSQAAGGTCAVGTTYAAGQTCTVEVYFKPTRPGQRFGGIVLADASGAQLGNSYVYGMGVGPEVGWIPGVRSLAGANLTTPSGVALDGRGDIFVSQYSVGVTEIPVSGPQRSIGSFGDTADVIVDGSGNLIVAGFTSVYRVDAVDGVIPANPTIETLASGLGQTNSIKVDATGNIFIATQVITNGVSQEGVSELLAVNGVVPVNPVIKNFGLGAFSDLSGVAVDPSGDIYVSDFGVDKVFEIEAVNGVIPASPTIRSLGGSYGEPSNVALDAANDVFVPDAVHGVYEIEAVNGVVPQTNPTVISLMGGGFVSPQGLYVDPSGNVYVADMGLTGVVKFDYYGTQSLTFATTAVGSTSIDSPQTVTMINNGNAPLTFAIPGSGSNASITPGFTIDGSSTCPVVTSSTNPAPTLGVGATCTQAVDFKPVAGGTDSGQLVATDNALNLAGSTQTVLLNGDGLSPVNAVLAAAPTTVYFGQNVMLTATVTPVTPMTPAPTGTVAFYDGTTELGTSALTGGSAVWNTTTLPVGADSLTCVYSGDTYYATAKCAAVTENVQLLPTAVTVTQSPDPAYALAPVTFTAKLTVNGQPAGAGDTVNFVLTGEFLTGQQTTGSAVTDATGTATFVFAPGFFDSAHSVAVSFNATATMANSTYTKAVDIIKNNTSMTLLASPSPGYQNQPESFVATVVDTTGPASPSDNGTLSVVFTDITNGSVPLGSVLLKNASGTNLASATLVTTGLAPGLHTIQAIYGGGLDFNGTSAVTVQVNILPQDFTLTANPPSITIQTEYHKSMPLTLTSIGGFSARISLTCPGPVPEWVTCTFPDGPVYLQANATAPVTLTIDTDALQDYKSETSGTGARVILAGLLPLMLFGLARKRRWRGLVLVAIASVMVVTMTACSGHYPAHTTPGTYTIAVQASGQTAGASAPTVHTLDVTLVVTP
jgi:uncharacterized repeat protein (TIGR03803 family)